MIIWGVLFILFLWIIAGTMVLIVKVEELNRKISKIRGPKGPAGPVGPMGPPGPPIWSSETKTEKTLPDALKPRMVKCPFCDAPEQRSCADPHTGAVLLESIHPARAEQAYRKARKI